MPPTSLTSLSKSATRLLTRIEWTVATINFWWGCAEVSPACANCYARETAKVRGEKFFGRKVEWGKGKPRAERLEKARKEAVTLNRHAEKSGERWPVFVNSMSDWLDEEVPIEWLAFLLETVRLCPQLDFQLLTKRPENWNWRMLLANGHLAMVGDVEHFETDLKMLTAFWIAEWTQGKPPANVWIGTTVEDQTRADSRIPALLNIPAVVRFLSCEPLLGPVDLNTSEKSGPMAPVDWVICGGESGRMTKPGDRSIRPMHPDWARSLRDQCQAAGVPFFFKQWGLWAPHPHPPQRGVNTGAGIHLKPDGRWGCQGDWWNGTAHAMDKVGKREAGRLLDGREWNEMPLGERSAA